VSNPYNPRQSGLKFILGSAIAISVTLVVLLNFSHNGSTGSGTAGNEASNTPLPPANESRVAHPTVTGSDSSSSSGLPSPPKFTIYKQSSSDPTSVVVAEQTTDEQIRSLLWFFRKKIRSQDFKAVGLTVPTSIKFGEKNWDDGLIFIYRGTKCANEEYIKEGYGPCGQGEHSAGFYQWGIEGKPAKDSGDLISKNGDSTPVFDYKDGWLPPPDVLAKLKAVEDARMEEEKARKTEEKVFASELQERVRNLGFDMYILTGPEEGELIIKSEMFDHDSGRVQFLSQVLPTWREDLCRVGFRTVLLKNGAFSVGNNYSIGCR
jgi:hypothetical protein